MKRPGFASTRLACRTGTVRILAVPDVALKRNQILVAQSECVKSTVVSITLVKDEDDRLLLGRQNSWAPGRFSNFAGFVEPGESFEQCVLREVEEESGLIVHSVHYLGSQPWPFPASIMIAFEARTSDVSTARADGEEIVEIKWFTRESMNEAVNSGEISLPPLVWRRCPY
jgi:NADH pyrophosphatase NudC (nudix superfamily)